MAKPVRHLIFAVSAVSVAGVSHADDLARGREVYQGTCIACHGSDGAGVLPGVPDFTNRSGPLGKSDAVLIDHIANGFQSPGSPMAMPAKGGDPTLTEQDVRAVLQYLKNEFGS